MTCLTCGLCPACQPKFRRHVDSIYPSDPTQGIVKTNLQKLTYYAQSNPEKLDKIGAYLSQRISRDIHRSRRSQVLVGADAMDHLLNACHGTQAFNLYIESFLKIVQCLLETGDPGLEIRATQSFESFSTKHEETPGYNRRYDFFISKFASLCHNNNVNLAMQDRLRVAGLRGLRGVVRKTVGDDLQSNIWQRQHMEKIVPSILYNLHDKSNADRTGADDDLIDDANVNTALVGSGGGGQSASSTNDCSPRQLADMCLRELVGKAAYGNMRSVLTPMLRHCDAHNLWTSPAVGTTATPGRMYATQFFTFVMYSVQTAYLYVVVQMLIEHLESHTAQVSVDVRIGIASALAAIIGIAAVSIGPALLEIFNSLLRHLRASVERSKCMADSLSSGSPTPTTGGADERRFQDTLIKSMGDFAYSLPNYQKFEVMMFVLGKIPTGAPGNRRAETDRYLQHVLVKTLLHVATKYETKLLAQTFTNTFMEALLRIALVDDNQVRLNVQQILHTLIDRHENTQALAHLRITDKIDTLDVTVEKCARADLVFWRQTREQWMQTMYASVAHANHATNSRYTYDATLATMLLLFVEFGCCDEVLVDLLRLVFALQSLAQQPCATSHLCSVVHRARLHALCARCMHCVRQLCDVPRLDVYVSGVCARRRGHASPLVDPYSTWHMRGAGVKRAMRRARVDTVGSAHISDSDDDDDDYDTKDEDLDDRAVPADVTDTYALAHLPPGAGEDEDSLTLDDDLLFEAHRVADALREHSATVAIDVTRLLVPFTPRTATGTAAALAAADAVGHDATSMSFSMASMDSVNSPGNRSRHNTLLGMARMTAPTFGIDGSALPAPLHSGRGDMSPPQMITTDQPDSGAVGSARAPQAPRARVDVARLSELLNTEHTPEAVYKREQLEMERVHELFTKTPFDELVNMQRAQYVDTSANIASILKRAQERRRQWQEQPSMVAGQTTMPIDDDITLPAMFVC